MSTTVMHPTHMAPSLMRHVRDQVRGVTLLPTLRQATLFVFGLTLPFTLLPTLFLISSLLMLCLPLALPFLLWSSRGAWPVRLQTSARSASSPRLLHGRLWDARDFVPR